MMLPRTELRPIIALLREIDARMLGPCSPHDLETFAARLFRDTSNSYYRTVWNRLPREVRAWIESYEIDADLEAAADALRNTETVRLFDFLGAAVQFFHQPMHYSDAAAVLAFRERCAADLKTLLRDLEATVA